MKINDIRFQILNNQNSTEFPLGEGGLRGIDSQYSLFHWISATADKCNSANCSAAFMVYRSALFMVHRSAAFAMLRYILNITVLLLIPLLGNSQTPDTTLAKTQLLNTNISLVMSYYSQDGNHSAVTGGIGTEELTVFAAAGAVGIDLDTNGRLLINLGIDVITSASTDNIDFNVSSASYHDNRIWVSAGYEHNFSKRRIQAGILPSASIESDYTSFGIRAWVGYFNKALTSSYSFSFQSYFDDLRWGRLNPDFRRPVTLVYPKELRDTAWFDIYMRYSYVFSFDYQHDINQRMALSIAPGFALQNGLLSTPFHRVFFEGHDEAVVENLPRNRTKFYLVLQLNWFVGKRLILKPYYRFYADDFGILAHTFALDFPVKISPQLSLIPFGRVYTQIASNYFNPFMENSESDEFYTSDYDLSKFNSYKIGLGLSYVPFAWLGKSKTQFKEFSVRYSYYWRTDGLYAHIISTFFDFGFRRIK